MIITVFATFFCIMGHKNRIQRCNVKIDKMKKNISFYKNESYI